MDEAVIKLYRKLIREGFNYTGSFENPSIFLDSIGENISICSKVAKSYIHLYIKIKDDRFEDIKYLCMCDPTANVAAEILCRLVKGKTINEVRQVTPDSFIGVLDGRSDDLAKKAAGLLELLGRGIERYQNSNPKPC